MAPTRRGSRSDKQPSDSVNYNVKDPKEKEEKIVEITNLESREISSDVTDLLLQKSPSRESLPKYDSPRRKTLPKSTRSKPEVEGARVSWSSFEASDFEKTNEKYYKEKERLAAKTKVDHRSKLKDFRKSILERSLDSATKAKSTYNESPQKSKETQYSPADSIDEAEGGEIPNSSIERKESAKKYKPAEKPSIMAITTVELSKLKGDNKEIIQKSIDTPKEISPTPPKTTKSKYTPSQARELRSRFVRNRGARSSFLYSLPGTLHYKTIKSEFDSSHREDATVHVQLEAVKNLLVLKPSALASPKHYRDLQYQITERVMKLAEPKMAYMLKQKKATFGENDQIETFNDEILGDRQEPFHYVISQRLKELAQPKKYAEPRWQNGEEIDKEIMDLVKEKYDKPLHWERISELARPKQYWKIPPDKYRHKYEPNKGQLKPRIIRVLTVRQNELKGRT